MWSLLASVANVTGISDYSHLPCSPKKGLASDTKSWSQPMRLIQAECVAISPLDIRAIPLNWGDIYLFGIPRIKLSPQIVFSRNILLPLQQKKQLHH